jgi:hypothetical protein
VAVSAAVTPGMPAGPDEATRAAVLAKIPGELAKHGIDELAALVKTRLKRMQHRPNLIQGHLAKTGLDLTM